jgi:hypothetical protein
MATARNFASRKFRIKLGHKYPIFFLHKKHTVVDSGVPTPLYVQVSRGLQ